MYGVENLCTYLDDKPMGQKKTRTADYEVVNGKKVAFDVTSPRFHFNHAFYKHSLKFEVPGPGQYEDSQAEKAQRPRTYDQRR